MAAHANVITEGNQTIRGVKTFVDAPVFSAGATDSTAVKTTGDQTIDGVKTFTSTPVFTDNSIVRTTGDQTITGRKTLTQAIIGGGFVGATLVGDPDNQIYFTDQDTSRTISFRVDEGAPVHVPVGFTTGSLYVDKANGNLYIHAGDAWKLITRAA